MVFYLIEVNGSSGVYWSDEQRQADWSIKAVLFLLIKSKVSDCSDKNKSTDMDARCDCKRRRKQILLGFPIKNAPVAHSPTKFSCFQVYFLLIWLIGHVQYCLHWTPCFLMVFSSLLFSSYVILHQVCSVSYHVFLIAFHVLRTETCFRVWADVGPRY